MLVRAAMNNLHFATFLLFGIFASGCSGSSDSDGSRSSANDSPVGAPLFEDSGSTATAGSVEGLWGGVLESPASTWSFDSRLRIGPTSITFATRCRASNGAEGAIAAVTTRARVSANEIAILESKEDKRTLGDITCRASSRPGSAKRCDAAAFTKTSCFELEGTSLTIYGDSPLDKLELTKLAD